MKELRKRAARALVALLQNDAKTALEELNVYKIELEDGEPILTPGHMIDRVWAGNPHPLAGREMWAIGIEHRPGEFGMTDGPVPTLEAMLERTGQVDSCIVHFFGDGTEEITHRWRDTEWVETQYYTAPDDKIDNPFED